MFKIIAIIAASLVTLIAIGYVLTMGAGKPISTDLSIIGQGRPALVLVYENYSPAGGDALNRLRQVRSDFDAQLDFVVAELGTPQGVAFADRYQLIDGQAMFLKPDGQPLEAISIPADEQALRARLKSKLKAVE